MTKRTVFYLVGLTVLAGASWLIVTMIFGYPGLGRQLVLAGVFWLLAVATFWIARRLNYKVFLAAGIFVLIALFLPASVLLSIFPSESAEPLGSSLLLGLFLLLSAALVLSAALFSSGIGLHGSGPEADAAPAAARSVSSKTAVFLLMLSAVLLAKSLHSLYRFTLWDNTHDGLGYICLGGPILAVFFAGFLLAAMLPGRAKVMGFLYVLIVPGLLIAVSTLGQRVDIRQLTEERAARVSGALDAYYEANGRYPQELRQLTPRYTLSLPEPAVIFGQNWCYESGEDAYVLGYVTRDHWSDPRLYGRVVIATSADDFENSPICEAEIAALIARAPQYYEVRRD